MKLLIIAALAVSCAADISLLPPRHRAPQNAFSSGGSDFLSAPRNTYIPPQNSYLPPQNTYVPPPPPQPPKQQYLPPTTTARPTTQYQPPQTSYLPPQSTYLPPQNTYVPPPQNTYVPPPQNTYRPPPQNSYIPPPQNSYMPAQKPQNSYLPPSGPTTPPVPILKQINEIHDDGSYKYETLTGDQTHIEQMGHIENIGTDHEEQVMHGSYSYVGDDGKTYTVTYVADSNGFRAVGDHLPTPPPIPEAIQKALDQNAAEEAAQASHGYPSGPSQGYPSGPAQGYPSGPAQGYPSGPPQQTYQPPRPNKPSYNPNSGYQY